MEVARRPRVCHNAAAMTQRLWRPPAYNGDAKVARQCVCNGNTAWVGWRTLPYLRSCNHCQFEPPYHCRKLNGSKESDIDVTFLSRLVQQNREWCQHSLPVCIFNRMCLFEQSCRFVTLVGSDIPMITTGSRLQPAVLPTCSLTRQWSNFLILLFINLFYWFCVILFISYGWETHIHQKSFKIYLYYNVTVTYMLRSKSARETPTYISITFYFKSKPV